MRIACVGAGPAGLYLAISLLRRQPDAKVEVFERNPEGVTFGWGVVFSDQTLDNLRRNDPCSADVIEAGDCGGSGITAAEIKRRPHSSSERAVNRIRGRAIRRR